MRTPFRRRGYPAHTMRNVVTVGQQSTSHKDHYAKTNSFENGMQVKKVSQSTDSF